MTLQSRVLAYASIYDSVFYITPTLQYIKDSYSLIIVFFIRDIVMSPALGNGSRTVIFPFQKDFPESGWLILKRGPRFNAIGPEN